MESRIDVQKQAKTRQKKPCAHEEREGKSNLCGHEYLTHAAGFFSSCSRARLFMERVADANLGNPGERKQTDKDSGGQRQREGNENDGTIHPDFIGAREALQ